MKILILSINYWPEVTGIGAFTTYRAEHLARAGHDVEVCTAVSVLSGMEDPREYAGRLAMTEERNGVKIVRSYLYVPNPVNLFKRILHEGSFILSSALRAGMRRRPDVLLAVSPPLGLAVTAILLSRLWRIPFVFDVEDLQPDSASDLGMLPAWAVRLLYGLEKAAYRHARLVTTLDPKHEEEDRQQGIAKEKVELFEPRMDDSLLDLLARRRERIPAEVRSGREIPGDAQRQHGSEAGAGRGAGCGGAEPRGRFAAVSVCG